MYSIKLHFFQPDRRTLMQMGVLLAVLLFSMLPLQVWATPVDSGLPFDEPLEKLKNAVSGPVAFTLSLMGIVAAGAMLIFGGDLTGFMRTIVFLVLVVAVIVGASSIIDGMGGIGAVVAALGTDNPLFANRAVKFA